MQVAAPEAMAAFALRGTKAGRSADFRSPGHQRATNAARHHGLSPEQWLEANIDRWGIETGLHARLDASRHDDR